MMIRGVKVLFSLRIFQASFSWLFALGAALIILGFVGVAILEHLGAWDPIWIAIKKLYVEARDSS